MRQTLAPAILPLSTPRLIFFTIVFVALDVFIPWLAHQFNPNAGPVFLPLHFFVFLAALLAGWRAGLLVGVLSPLTSFGLSGLPPIGILPQLISEVAAYGLVAGYLQKKYRPNLWLTLLVAMVAGRLVLGAAAWVLSAGQADAGSVIQGAVAMGWPGILIQLLALPPLTIALGKWLKYGASGQT